MWGLFVGDVRCFVLNVRTWFLFLSVVCGVVLLFMASLALVGVVHYCFVLDSSLDIWV